MLSVIIPTRDRPERLAETLAAIAGQAGDDLEVLVVNDGSQQATRAWLSSPPPLPFPLRILHQPALGPAAARNRGVAAARGERVLLLGDDTRPAPGCLDVHRAAGAGERGLQGRIDWDPAQPITEAMAFLAPAGPQFFFRGRREGEKLPYTLVYGSNCSLPTRWLREEPFDETFPGAALEDTEAAYRWQLRGWRVEFAERAVAWHHHHYENLEPFLERQRRAGAAARMAVRKHPALRWPLVDRELWAGARQRVRGWLGRERPSDAWWAACRQAYLEGYERAGADAPGVSRRSSSA